MGYLAFKERMNTLKTDEYERRRFMDRAQVYGVAGFWIFFTVALLVYGHEKDKRERAAHRPPTIPEAVSVSQDGISLPSAPHLKRK